MSFLSDATTTKPASSLSYRCMRASWSGRGVSRIFVHGYDEPFNIPTDFLKRSGCYDLELVLQLAQELVIERGELVTADGVVVDLSDAPQEDVSYCLVPVHEGGFHWAKGPESGSTGRKAKVVANDETSSSRARDQCDFREELVCRDGRCILTGTARSECDAAHLVPTTREDVYELVLGDDFGGFFYEAATGVLLSKTLHKHYYGYRWSFKCLENGDMIVHVFDPEQDPILVQLHGKVVKRDAFRVFGDDGKYPDARLCAWHYHQCAIKHLRGFSAGFNAL